MTLIERLRTHTMCPTPEECADALERLTDERDALASDAARYRFVRSNGLVRVQVDVDFMNAWGEYSHEALDAAIDAVDFNSMLKRPHTFTAKLEPRKGYKLATFEVTT